MRTTSHLAILLSATIFGIGLPSQAHGQSGPAAANPPAPPPAAPPSGGGNAPTSTTVVVNPPAPTVTTTTTAPSRPDVNAYLPSSAKPSTDISTSTDGFDLNNSSTGSVSVHGSANASYVVTGQQVPEIHSVKRGDTLWKIAAKYFNNPYNWPQIWAGNSQIQNPHWLYPGDQLRLRGHADVKQVGSGVGYRLRRRMVPASTLFHRHRGFALDGVIPTWGRIIGSPTEKMLLVPPDEIYIKMGGKEDREVGQLLTIFERRTVSNPANLSFIWIRGVAKINRFNRKTKMARAQIIEALRPIERGVLVGPLNHEVTPITPKPNEKTVQASIIGSLYPLEVYGQNQLVFIDKGTSDGIAVGNRLFALARQDAWRDTLDNAGKLATERPLLEEDRPTKSSPMPNTNDPELYPAETYAELVVVSARKYTAACLVTASNREIERDAILVARKGY